MNKPISRAASRFTEHGLLLGGAPAVAVQPAEAMPEASAPFLGFLLYQAANRSKGASFAAH